MQDHFNVSNITEQNEDDDRNIEKVKLLLETEVKIPDVEPSENIWFKQNRKQS